MIRTLAAYLAPALLLALPSVAAEIELGGTKLFIPDDAEILDHGRRHTGVDLKFAVGEVVHAPIAGRIAWIVSDLTMESDWQGVVLEGDEPQADLTLRLLGLKPTVAWGDEVVAGQVIGHTQDAAADFPGIRPYLHVEIYLSGQRVDPTEWTERFWPDHPVVNAGADVDWDANDWPQQRVLDKAYEARVAGDHAAAVALYRQAPSLSDWEVSNTHLYRELAEVFAEAGKYRGALEIQRALVAFLELELEFAEGTLPSGCSGR